MTTKPAAKTAALCGRAADPPPAYDHVVWIWMENHSYGDVIGNAAAPYETELARRCGTATNYAEIGSPSLPNYLGATSGDIHGVHDDAGPSSHPLDVDNLFRQVRASGRSERSLQESMPRPCALESSGRYAVKHNPAPYYVGADDRTACQANDVPLTDAGDLAAFTFVTPNLCNDTHDCPPSAGDAWLRQWVPKLLARAAYDGGRTALFIVWDEDTPMPFIVVSPATRPGSVMHDRVDHYALLRTTEEMLGLPLLGQAAAAPSMRAAFRL